jgi:PAS domain S-box-containing protein
MFHVALWSPDNASLCTLALAAFGRAAGAATVETTGCAPGDAIISTTASEMTLAMGIPPGGCRPVPLDSVKSNVDVLIQLNGPTDAPTPVHGSPIRLAWNLDASAKAVTPHDYRTLLADLERLSSDFFQRGYFAALIEMRNTHSLVLDNISDAIVAHDLNRIILHFNRAAEQLTGFSRSEVLNRDCHQVFRGPMCGGKCQFCDSGLPPHEVSHEEMTIVNRSGESRRVSVTRRFLTAADGTKMGILASFKDITREHALARRIGEASRFSGIISRDKRMLEIFDLIGELANSTAPVMIQGESGTGKELVAAAIHNEGARAGRQFVPVNCGALPESLLESELFGHVKGAFTGAFRDKKGRFELADGGTIFLDEIGDISPAMQVKLLRVLQEGTFERVGGEQTIRADVRVISATNKDISDEITAGRFREDLFYRLSVVPLWLPPLRDRRNDIPLLATHILTGLLKSAGRETLTLSNEAMDVLLSHTWPGNVRELQNWLQFALIKCHDGAIRPEHLPPMQHRFATRAPELRHPRKLDAEAVKYAIQQAAGNKVEAARILGISRATLYRFMEAANVPL